MRSGARRHRVTFQRAIETQDSTGGIVTEWQTYFNAWAAINPVRAYEKRVSDRFISGEDLMVNIRYCKEACNLTEKHRMRHNDIHYDITGVVNVGMRNREMEISVKSIRNHDYQG